MNATEMTTAAAALKPTSSWADVCDLMNAVADFDDAYYRILRDGKPRPTDMLEAAKAARAAIKAWFAENY